MHKRPPTKTSTVKKPIAGKPANGKAHPGQAGHDTLAPMDRRASHDRRNKEDRRTQSIAVIAERRVLQRRAKVTRRRQIDPTTCERDYTPDEIEFMGALDEYKRSSGRMFPTCSEVLEVLRKLGYEKCRKEEAAIMPAVALPFSTVTQPATF